MSVWDWVTPYLGLGYFNAWDWDTPPTWERGTSMSVWDWVPPFLEFQCWQDPTTIWQEILIYAKTGIIRTNNSSTELEEFIFA